MDPKSPKNYKNFLHEKNKKKNTNCSRCGGTHIDLYCIYFKTK